MFVFFGVRTTRKILSEGEFHCPQCDDRRPYRERRDKEWGHLYYIPIIPMDEFPPYIECRTCKARFDPMVLAIDPESEKRFAETFEKACLHSCVSIALMGNQDSETVRDLIYQLMKTLRSTHAPMSREMVDDAFRSEAGEGTDISALMQALSRELNEAGRETVLINLVEVVLADGHQPTQDQTESIRRCGEWIGISPRLLRGIIAEMEERAAAPA